MRIDQVSGFFHRAELKSGRVYSLYKLLLYIYRLLLWNADTDTNSNMITKLSDFLELIYKIKSFYIILKVQTYCIAQLCDLKGSTAYIQGASMVQR